MVVQLYRIGRYEQCMSKAEYTSFSQFEKNLLQPRRSRYYRWLIRGIIGFVVLSIVVISSWVAIWIRIHWPIKFWLFCLSFGLFIGCVFYIWFIKMDLKRRVCTIRAFTMLHRCPACTYKLSGVECQADQCTVCPECGAAWHLPSKEWTEESPR